MNDKIKPIRGGDERPSWIKIKLFKPVTVGAVTIDEVTVQTPKAKDFLGTGKDFTFNDQMLVISRITGLSLDIIGEIEATDFNRITNAFVSLMEEPIKKS